MDREHQLWHILLSALVSMGTDVKIASGQSSLRFWMFDAWVSLASEWHTHWQSLFETGLTHDDFITNSLAMSCIPNLT